ncbi:DUF7260 family protein [Halorussus amylolyticus]|uniref:DUF7260 family protein n=1 Tax=Halorussus amylolyticus TaxID=1126242 RepID=UPI001053F269|nr:hypothetical protein [Halorussus amylolyticus]
MTVELRTHAAIERADAERDRIEAKADAFDAFDERVRAISATPVGRASASAATASAPGGALAVLSGKGGPTDAGGTKAVREAFAATVLPRVETDSARAAMADELSPDLATALSSAGAGFAPELKARLVSRIGERRAECRLLADAIGTERDRLASAADRLDEMTEWVADADDTPLSDLGFDGLRARHDRLAAFRATCDELARDRQADLRGTHRDGPTGVRARELLDLLYDDFADGHPLLADIARLDSLLADCQRAVRRHLCSRA